MYLKRLLIICQLLIFILSSPIYSQWSEDGVLARPGGFDRYCANPTQDGGVWITWETPVAFAVPEIRTQRVDSEGYLLFNGEAGISVTDDSIRIVGDPDRPLFNYLMGCAETSNDELWVVFCNYGLHTRYYYSIYAQRFTSDGQRVYGDSARIVSQLPMNQYCHFSGPIPVIGDGHDGFWAIYTRGTDDSIWLCGLNADGSPKLEEDLYIGAGREVEFASNCRDNIFLTWRKGTGNVAYQGISEDGTLLLDEPGDAGRITGDINAVGDTTGGFYFGGINNFQRIAADGSLPWGIGGIRYNNLYPSHTTSSWLTLTSDNGVAALIVEHSNALHLARVDSEGNPYYPDFTTIIDSSDFSFNNPIPFIVYDESRNKYWIGYNKKILPTPYRFKLIHRLIDDSTLADSWNPDSVYIGPYESINTISNNQQVIFGSDNSLILVHNRNTANIKIYKLFDNGLWSYELDVASNDSPDLPLDFEISGAYPNPFNNTVRFILNVGKTMYLKYTIYNIHGQEISHCGQTFLPGTHELSWSPANGTSTGIYFVSWEGQNKISKPTKIVYIR